MFVYIYVTKENTKRRELREECNNINYLIEKVIESVIEVHKYHFFFN